MSARLIIFSRNRAMQLDGLLRSIQRYAPKLYDPPIIIYRADGHDFEYGYEQAQRDWPKCEWWEEIAFEDDVRAACKQVEHAQEWIAFHTDDDLWYQPAPASVLPLANEVTMAFRLGENTTYCHPLDCEQTPPTGTPWKWTEAECDFGYPFSLSGGCIYRAELVSQLLKSVEGFKGPNDFEHRCHEHFVVSPGRWPPMLAAPLHSCVVIVPANRVNDGYGNPCSSNPEWAPEALNRQYLDGWRLDLDAMDFGRIVGGHQEVPLRFRRD